MAETAKPRRGKKKKSIWGRIAFAVATLVLVGLIAGVGAFIYLYSTTDIPDPNADFQTNTTFINYADGTQMGSLSVQNRVTLAYDDMPKVMKDAVVAAENRSFWTDPGFSVTGMARGAWSIARGGEVQGGSTITQQYIKVMYLDSSRTLTRKVRELMLAIKLDREVSKEQILEGYLNTIYFGRGAYGIEAASKSFFLKDAKDLTLSEAAALAAILNNPAAFNPSGGDEHRARLLTRYQYVLDGMLEEGMISQADYAGARPQLPEFPEVPVSNRYGGPNGYLIKRVEAELEAKGIPQDQVQGGGLRVTTTIDKRMQDRAVEVAQKYTQEAAAKGDEGAKPEDLHVALASVDTATGGVLAMYGGPDYVEHPRNWATTPRAAASTYKAFATVAALRQGFDLNTMLNGDTFTPRGDTKPIHNQAKRNYGEVTLRESLAKSINTAFVDLTEQMAGGPEAIVQAAEDAGAPPLDNWEQHSRIALGFNEVSPLNMANAYATFANSGERNQTHMVAKVEDRHGNVIYEAEKKPEQTIEPDVAAAVTDGLRSVVDDGTGRSARTLDRPVAGKTGTNGIDDTITAAWFTGYTKQVSTAVMFVAGEGGTGDLVPYRAPGDRTFYASSYPLSAWVEYMTTAVEGMPVEDFDNPPTPEPIPSPTPTEEPTSEEPSEEPTTEEPTEEPTTEEPTPEPSEDPTLPSELPTEVPSGPIDTDPPQPEPTGEEQPGRGRGDGPPGRSSPPPGRGSG